MAEPDGAAPAPSPWGPVLQPGFSFWHWAASLYGTLLSFWSCSVVKPFYWDVIIITCRVAFLDESHTPKCWTSYFAHSRYLLIITMSYIGLGVHYLQSTIIRYIAILLIHQCQEAGIIFISSREEETGLKKERIAQGHSASCLQMTSFFLLAWLTDWMNVT